jgi:hypothetical protein
LISGSYNAAKLDLPKSYSRIHHVFHVFYLLKTYHAGTNFLPVAPPEPLVEDGIPMYSVEKILSTRIRVGKRRVQEFLI